LAQQNQGHQPFRLQNQYFDEETGLHYNFLRYYDPITGRFTTQDPIGLKGGMNLYRFEGAVQNQIDPLGMDARTSCSYKIKQQELSCTRTESEKFLGIFTKSSKTQTITINSADGVFSGGYNSGPQGKCANDSSEECLKQSNTGPVLPGAYTMVYKGDRFNQGTDAWWLDEGVIKRRTQKFFYNRDGGFYMHTGRVSHGCVTVYRENPEGMRKYEQLSDMLKKPTDSPIIMNVME
ncbi:RHS repeat-associated core domain-containing protein, partial [Rodentibacter genomosp. 2]